MSSKLVTINAADAMTNAYKLMHEKKIRHLPVVDERNAVVGILSDRDIQRAMQVTKVNNFAQNVHLDSSLRVEEFMSWPVYVVSEDTTVNRVAEKMLGQKVSAFLVQDMKGKIKGIITTDDLLKLFLEQQTKQDSLGMKALSYYFTGPELY